MSEEDTLYNHAIDALNENRNLEEELLLAKVEEEKQETEKIFVEVLEKDTLALEQERNQVKVSEEWMQKMIEVVDQESSTYESEMELIWAKIDEMWEKVIDLNNAKEAEALKEEEKRIADAYASIQPQLMDINEQMEEERNSTKRLDEDMKAQWVEMLDRIDMLKKMRDDKAFELKENKMKVYKV